jgi:PHD/YefM family antitoxin component YafN of YafNO toxin-antitoxin module
MEITTQLKPKREMGTAYEGIATSLKNRNRFIITDDNGKSESVIISIAEYDAMKEAAWEQYVSSALAEVEVIKDDPATWLSIEEFWQE